MVEGGVTFFFLPAAVEDEPPLLRLELVTVGVLELLLLLLLLLIRCADCGRDECGREDEPAREEDGMVLA